MTIKTLIDTLGRFPADAPLRILTAPGELSGVAGVTLVAGRVTIKPTFEPEEACPVPERKAR